MQRCRTLLDKDLINTGIYESAGKQSLPLVQLVQQLLRYRLLTVYLPPHSSLITAFDAVGICLRTGCCINDCSQTNAILTKLSIC